MKKILLLSLLVLSSVAIQFSLKADLADFCRFYPDNHICHDGSLTPSSLKSDEAIRSEKRNPDTR